MDVCLANFLVASRSLLLNWFHQSRSLSNLLSSVMSCCCCACSGVSGCCCVSPCDGGVDVWGCVRVFV